MKIRFTNTASNAQAVQVVRYQKNKRIVLQHIGSAHAEEALNDLMLLAGMGKRQHQPILDSPR